MSDPVFRGLPAREGIVPIRRPVESRGRKNGPTRMVELSQSEGPLRCTPVPPTRKPLIQPPPVTPDAFCSAQVGRTFYRMSVAALIRACAVPLAA